MEIPSWKAKLAEVCSLLSSEHCCQEKTGARRQLVSVFSPTVTTDGWVIGSLQSSSFPPLHCSSCSHFDLSGQRLGPSWGISSRKWYWFYTTHISNIILRVYKACLYVCFCFPEHKRFPPSQISCDPSRGKEMQEQSREKERGESLLVSLWESFISKTATYNHS